METIKKILTAILKWLGVFHPTNSCTSLRVR